ncbi:MAG: molybdate ABC transporter substrate-binding protein [Herbaspirillum sp.]
MKKLSLPILLVSLFAATSPAQAADMLVFAAASLKESLSAAATAYEHNSGNKVVLSFAASSALARQIEGGAPADMFLSADLDWMNYLADRKLIQPARRKNLLANQLVLIAPASSTSNLKIKPGFDLAAQLGNNRLALANPDSVPAGKYAKAALQSLDVWPQVEPLVARAANVRAALVLVARAEAPYGIVYRTDALAEPKVRIVDTFPETSHAPIIYPMALTINSHNQSAQEFANFLSSKQAQPIWVKYGFKTLD